MSLSQASMLSKSQFIKGQQCTKALWYSRNRKDLTPPTDAAKQAMFSAGNEVGEWAKKCFEGGVEVTTPYFKVQEGAEATKALLAAGNSIIFEATAIHPEDGTYSRIDILRKIEGDVAFDLIEVKGSTGVKEYHIEDMSFQYRVFSSAGYRINRCFMMLINNQYERNGEIDPQALFKLEDITAEVASKQSELEQAMPHIIAAYIGNEEPAASIGSRCSKPFDCDYIDHCWKHVPEYSIFDIFAGKKADEITAMIGSYEIKSLSDEQMPAGAKAKDVRSFLSGEIHSELDSIRQFVSRLRYPLYYLDYETIGGAIPIFEGTKPFQAIPFQFSVHIEAAPDAELKHFEFLHKNQSDPRKPFIEALLGFCGSEGSVIVYNQPFEKGVNESLMRDFPEQADAIKAINDRMIDLLVPFKNRWLYHPRQNSSASIKKVLPAFTDLSYEHLGIGNGQDASQKYLDFMQGKLRDADVKKLWADLTEYCGLDTLAMKALMDVLRGY